MPDSSVSDLIFYYLSCKLRNSCTSDFFEVGHNTIINVTVRANLIKHLWRRRSLRVILTFSIDLNEAIISQISGGETALRCRISAYNCGLDLAFFKSINIHEIGFFHTNDGAIRGSSVKAERVSASTVAVPISNISVDLEGSRRPMSVPYNNLIVTWTSGV